MKFNDKYRISKGYEDLFSFRDEKDELDYEAHLLMFRFLSEVERIVSEGKTLKNKDIALKLGVSPSYITQLLRGDKLMNFIMLAKIQKAFNITFEIKARINDPLPVTGIMKKKSGALTYADHLSEGKEVYRKKK